MTQLDVAAAAASIAWCTSSADIVLSVHCWFEALKEFARVENSDDQMVVVLRGFDLSRLTVNYA